MDLKTFVSESLTQISEGIKDAQAKTAENILICPENFPPNLSGYTPRTKEKQIQQQVKFDIALTAGEDNTTKGGAGIKVAGLGLSMGGGKNISQSSTSVSRIQFEINVIW